MVNPICVTLTGILEFPKLKKRICCSAKKSVQLNTDFIPPFKSQTELFFSVLNLEALISNETMNAAHISIIKVKQHLSYIIGI